MNSERRRAKWHRANLMSCQNDIIIMSMMRDTSPKINDKGKRSSLVHSLCLIPHLELIYELCHRRTYRAKGHVSVTLIRINSGNSPIIECKLLTWLLVQYEPIWNSLRNNYGAHQHDDADIHGGVDYSNREIFSEKRDILQVAPTFPLIWRMDSRVDLKRPKCLLFEANPRHRFYHDRVTR